MHKQNVVRWYLYQYQQLYVPKHMHTYTDRQVHEYTNILTNTVVAAYKQPEWETERMGETARLAYQWNLRVDCSNGGRRQGDLPKWAKPQGDLPKWVKL